MFSIFAKSADLQFYITRNSNTKTVTYLKLSALSLTNLFQKMRPTRGKDSAKDVAGVLVEKTNFCYSKTAENLEVCDFLCMFMCDWAQDYDIRRKTGRRVFVCVSKDTSSNNKVCWTHHTVSETVLVLLDCRDKATELSDPIKLHCQDMPIIIKAQEESVCVLTSKPVKELDKYTFNFLSVSRDL